jgi:hypothetical protein
VFRVGDDDAKKLAEEFSFFEARDLKNLETGQAIARVERSDFDFNLSIPLPDQLDEAEAAKRRQQVITASREKYGTPRAQVEALLRQAWESEQQSQRPAKTEAPCEQPPVPKPPPMPAAVPASPPVQTSEMKAAEIPKGTGSEKQEAVVAPVESKPPVIAEIPKPKEEPASVTTRENVPPRDLGRGGAQHKAIQHRLKTEAEVLGFAATIEKEIPHGSVDLLLERGGVSIACEISVTTTIDHEVGNAAKCLRAGFNRVAVICQTEERLERIQSAVTSSIGGEAASDIGYFQPDQFIAHLRGLTAAVPAGKPASSESTVIRRGRKVVRKTAMLSEEERQQREEVMLKQLTEIMHQRPSVT